ncbi:hypothetical protein IGI39_004765 [Enterococcus sp. AZ135]|uniref:hypothetical protein n=1 Tax=unclassified Enterococcus TaxID=2608891 RepID=UPI003F27B65C
MTNRLRIAVPVVVGAIIVLLFGLCSYEKVTNQKLKKSNDQLEAKIEKVTTQYDVEKKKRSLSEKKNKQLIASQITDKNSEVYQQFSSIVTNYFTSRFNYTPKDYEQSKESVKNLLSDDLYKKLFGDSFTYGDSNNVSSRLDKLEIFSGSVENNKIITGFLTVDYENKMAETDWYKNSEIYTVSYDLETQKITDIKSLGSYNKGLEFE